MAAKLDETPIGPIFAAFCTGPASKATDATKSETVKPMAAAQAAIPENDGFPDLLAGDREEEGHENVVDQIMRCPPRG